MTNGITPGTVQKVTPTVLDEAKAITTACAAEIEVILKKHGCILLATVELVPPGLIIPNIKVQIKPPEGRTQ